MSIEEFEKLDAKDKAMYLLDEFDRVGPDSELLRNTCRADLKDLYTIFKKISIASEYMRNLTYMFLKAT